MPILRVSNRSHVTKTRSLSGVLSALPKSTAWLGALLLAWASACGPAEEAGGFDAVSFERLPVSSTLAHSSQRCATRDLTREELLRAHGESAERAPSFVGATIDVYFHVICKGAGAKCMGSGLNDGNIPDAQIQKQINVLNERFATAATGLYFRLAGVDRTTNNDWFDFVLGPPLEPAMKKALYRGSKADLNVYSVNFGAYLGISAFPEDYSSGEPWMDGVILRYTTLPDGSEPRYNQGLTLVHEVGHWVGLFHTFQNGCNVFNDGVNDTPVEDTPAFGCLTGRDSCPGIIWWGLDPIHNYMDYSDDSCLTEFTSGQVNRMTRQLAKYRL